MPSSVVASLPCAESSATPVPLQPLTARLPSCWTAWDAWSTADTTRLGSRWSVRADSTSSRPRASWTTCVPRWLLPRLTRPRPASGTPAGPPTAARPPRTPTRTAPAVSRWCTTASSRTSAPCAPRSRRLAACCCPPRTRRSRLMCWTWTSLHAWPRSRPPERNRGLTSSPVSSWRRCRRSPSGWRARSRCWRSRPWPPASLWPRVAPARWSSAWGRGRASWARTWPPSSPSPRGLPRSMTTRWCSSALTR